MPILFMLSSCGVTSSWGDAACPTVSSAKDSYLSTMEESTLPLLHQASLRPRQGRHRDPHEPP